MSAEEPAEGLSLEELAVAAGARLIGEGEIRVRRVRLPDEAGPDEIGFAPHPRFFQRAGSTRAAALLTSLDVAADRAHELPCAVLASDNPALALARILEALHPRPSSPLAVDDRAAVHVEARLGAGVSVGAFAYVGRALLHDEVRVMPGAFIDDDVEVGAGSVIGPSAVLLRGVRLGEEVLVHPGAVIGADGFRFAPEGRRNVKVPQVAGVIIDDDVEIGANACVDRGDLRDTRVGTGTRIDNLAQIAHGVQVGADAVVIAQVAIGGDTEIGPGAVIGGHAAVSPYLVVGEGARVGGKSGVTRDVGPGEAVAGVPAYGHLDWLKTSARLPGLDKMARRLKEAEAKIEALTRRLAELEDLSND